jgi:hypothetical protein
MGNTDTTGIAYSHFHTLVHSIKELHLQEEDFEDIRSDGFRFSFLVIRTASKSSHSSTFVFVFVFLSQ